MVQNQLDQDNNENDRHFELQAKQESSEEPVDSELEIDAPAA